MIKEENGRFYVYNHTGTKRLPPEKGYATRKEANHRIQEIEAFKHMNDKETTSQEAKFAKVMREFEAGNLKTSAGKLITSRRQAEAVAASEAGISKDK